MDPADRDTKDDRDKREGDVRTLIPVGIGLLSPIVGLMGGFQVVALVVGLILLHIAGVVGTAPAPEPEGRPAQMMIEACFGALWRSVMLLFWLLLLLAIPIAESEHYGIRWVVPYLFVIAALMFTWSLLSTRLALVWLHNAWERADYAGAVRRTSWVGPELLGGTDLAAGEILYYAGQYVEAERRLRHQLRHESSVEGAPISCAVLGEILAAQGKMDEAEQILKRAAAEAGPRITTPHFALADFYLEQGTHLDEALSLIIRAESVEGRPRSILGTNTWTYAEICSARAWALARMGLRGDAERACEEALKTCPEGCKPGLASVLYRVGQAHRALHDLSRARADFTQAVGLDPQGRYGALAKRALATL